MRKAILCFLERGDEVLLLHTDYGDKKVWNGVSGYIDGGESAVEAAAREIKEEIGVDVVQDDLLIKGAHDIFTVFILKRWAGIPESKETSIKELRWFKKNDLPFSEMHAGNKEWLLDLIK